MKVRRNPIAATFGPEKGKLYAALLEEAERARASTPSVSVWWSLTPALAMELLEDNPNNRNPSNEVIARYARDMTNGTWRASHQGGSLGPRLQIGDMQHRCYAVIKSGVTLRIKIDWYPDDEAFEAARPTWDHGHKRTKANVLEQTGAVARGEGRPLSAVLESIAAADRRYPVKMSNEDMLAMFAHMGDSVRATLALDHREFHGAARAAFAIAHAKCPKEIEQCIRMMATKANIPDGSAAQALLLKIKDIQGGQSDGFRTLGAAKNKRLQIVCDVLSLLYRHVKVLPGIKIIRRSNIAALKFFLGENARALAAAEEEQ